ncbi:MAG TPA: ABC transporter ATP-binding protein [Acidisarcina sp.]
MKPIIEISHLSKEFFIGQQRRRSESFRELLIRKMGLSKDRSPGSKGGLARFVALDDLSFNVAEGEVIGIIGRNGAGKSTLLKILSRITDPTSGTVHLRGRMASLLEVGTGFHPELTGRENIFLNGAILGLRKGEIVAKFDEIVAFSEIDQFLDTPVKRYSSGMYVRLAFAVAAHLNPEILVVDEVLAVGDMAFQKKCLGKMNEVSRGGRTVVFVSHNMAAVDNLCHRGIVLERGRLAFDGSTKDAIQHYLNTAAPGVSAQTVEFAEESPGRKSVKKLLRKVELFTDGDAPLHNGLVIGGRLKARIHFKLLSASQSFHVGLGFNNMFNQRVFTASSQFEPDGAHAADAGAYVFTCDIPSLTLMPGDYTVAMWIDLGLSKADWIEDAFRITIIDSDYYGSGKAPWNGMFVLPQSWRLETSDEVAAERVMERAAT